MRATNGGATETTPLRIEAELGQRPGDVVAHGKDLWDVFQDEDPAVELGEGRPRWRARSSGGLAGVGGGRSGCEVGRGSGNAETVRPTHPAKLVEHVSWYGPKIAPHVRRRKLTRANRLGDGRLVSGSDRTLKIWDAASGAELATLTGHTGTVWAVAALDGGRLVSASDDETLKKSGTRRAANSWPSSSLMRH